MKYTYILILTLLSIGAMKAQNVTDAVRYSNYDPIGTARMVGVGGAFGAMGGDFSVIVINPAGIAEYRKSEFNITPSIGTSKTNSFFTDDAGNQTTRTNSNFALDNIGFVTTNNNASSGWQTSNWGIGFSKLASFNRNITVTGTTEGSITERFKELAQGKTLDELDGFEAGPAYDAGAIFTDAAGNYVSDFLDGDQVTKDQAIDQKGSINELSFAWGGNYDNVLNVGISAGIPFISYDETKSYREQLVEGDFSNDLQYTETLNTTGVGLNFKMGVQYKAMRQLRLGVALHSPTWMTLNDDYNSVINYRYATANENFSGSGQSPDGSFKYKLNTPWKVVGSIGSIYSIGELKGFVNADIEFLDYSNNEFDFTKYSSDPAEAAYTQEINTNIDNQLGTATNIRLGTEVAYNSLRVRGGYLITTSPFVSETEMQNSWSAGLGFRADKFFIDFAYKARTSTDGYNPYVVLETENRDPLVNIENDLGRMVATVGFKF